MRTITALLCFVAFNLSAGGVPKDEVRAALPVDGTTRGTAIVFDNEQAYKKYPSGTWLKDAATMLPFQKP